MDRVAQQYFGDAVAGPGSEALARPILFSHWLSGRYESVDQEELRAYVQARLKVFYEEELDVPLVLFDEVLDHILRIDRIFRQPQGHALLVGVSGGGKVSISTKCVRFAFNNNECYFSVGTRLSCRALLRGWAVCRCLRSR